jgi:hypothetical protein
VKHTIKGGKCLGSTVNRLDGKFVDAIDAKTKKKKWRRYGCGFNTPHGPALVSHQKSCSHVASHNDVDEELEALEQELRRGKAMHGSTDKLISMSDLTHKALGMPQLQQSATARQAQLRQEEAEVQEYRRCYEINLHHQTTAVVQNLAAGRPWPS